MTSPSQAKAESSCPFGQIAAESELVVALYEDVDIIAFLDRGAIRPGRTRIISREHIPRAASPPPSGGGCA